MHENGVPVSAVRREFVAYFDKSSFTVAITVAPSKAVLTLLA